MIGLVLGAVVVGLVIAMLMAPLETLGWWAGWYGNDGNTRPVKSSYAPYRTYGRPGVLERRHFIVFLDGIAKVGDVNYDDVQETLAELGRTLPGATVLGDVMPYSVLNRGLLADRPLARFWRLAFRLKREGRAPLINFMINMRNLFQVLVAADSRYGPLFGQGEAAAILNSLMRQGYVPDTHTPVTLIGYSGGSQVALTAAPYLRDAIRGPLNVISLAGVMASEPGLVDIDHLWHLQGSKDPVPRMAALLFPGRWRLYRGSWWNRMIDEGRYTHVQLPAITHSGRGSYLDQQSPLGDSTPRAVTMAVLTRILSGIQLQENERHGLASRTVATDSEETVVI